VLGEGRGRTLGSPFTCCSEGRGTQLKRGGENRASRQPLAPEGLLVLQNCSWQLYLQAVAQG
jgi:hypothetical protein